MGCMMGCMMDVGLGEIKEGEEEGGGVEEVEEGEVEEGGVKEGGVKGEEGEKGERRGRSFEGEGKEETFGRGRSLTSRR